MAHRFKNVDISKVTLRNYSDVLPTSLIKQIEIYTGFTPVAVSPTLLPVPD